MTAALLLLALAAAPQEAPAAVAPRASAVADGERLRKVQERRAALEQELARLRGEEKSLLGEVEQLELELRLRTEELTEIQITLKRTRAQLDATVARVRQLETSLAAARPALAAHARALYKLGDMSYLRLLLSIDRPSDFFRGYRFITTLARRDNARVVGLPRGPRRCSRRRGRRSSSAPASRSRCARGSPPRGATSTASAPARRSS